MDTQLIGSVKIVLIRFHQLLFISVHTRKWIFFLKEIGLEDAVNKFSEHRIEINQLQNLTEEEIKELLPVIGDRHILKTAINNKRKSEEANIDEDQSLPSIRKKLNRTTNSSGLVNKSAFVNESGPINKSGPLNESRLSNRLEKNDVAKMNFIINIMKTDESLTSDLIDMAEKWNQEYPLLISKYNRSGSTLIDVQTGKLNCPLNKICSIQITPQFRSVTPVKWLLNNYKRHLNWHFDKKPSLLTKRRMYEVASSSDSNQSNNEAYYDSVRDTSILEVVLDDPPDQIEKNPLSIDITGCFLMRNIRKYHRKGTVKYTTKTRNVETTILKMKQARVADILREICEEIGVKKDEDGQYLLVKVNPPTKEICPEYYEKIERPIDLSTIESNVGNGKYKSPGSFDEDVLLMFSNVVKFYGVTSAEGVAAKKLLNCYTTKKESAYQRLLAIINDSHVIKSFLSDKMDQLLLYPDQNEHIIRCICGLFNDEVNTTQCIKCLAWQHTDCIQSDKQAESYLCEQCDNRTVDKEIPLNEYTEEGHRCYLTLMRGELQLHQGDTVYVLRDILMTPESETTITTSSVKHTYKTIGQIEYSECDVFRVERLWKDDDGNRFVCGHHFLRSQETFHKSTRKFFKNELFRVPLFEKISIDLVAGPCWVLDPVTFSKGRPIDCEELHVYICEFRVDKKAKIFHKISNPYPVCMKPYAFHNFSQRLKITRDYSPHHIATLP